MKTNYHEYSVYKTGWHKDTLLGRDVLISFKSHLVEGCPDTLPDTQALRIAGWIQFSLTAV